MPAASPELVTAVVVIGGDPIDPDVLTRLPEQRYVVAVDSGLDEAMRLGVAPDVVIGDMDSVSSEALERSAATGVEQILHPTDKDATDLELALDHVCDEGYRRATLFGGYGGRMSHFLGNALVLAAPKFAGMALEWHVGRTTVTVVWPGTPLTIDGDAGDLVSLLAVGGDAGAVTTTGLRWPLTAAQLATGSTRGISNEMVAARATVAIGGGALLVLHERTSQ